MVFYKYFILMKSVVELYFQLRSDFRVHFDTQSKQPASWQEQLWEAVILRDNKTKILIFKTLRTERVYRPTNDSDAMNLNPRAKRI